MGIHRMMRRVCILGAGSVGGHLAARLAAAGVSTAVVVRTAAHAEAIRQFGLTLRTSDGDILGWPQATHDAASLPPQDVVFVATKAYSLPATVDVLTRLVRPGVPIVYFNNGVPWWYRFGDGGASGTGPLARLDPGGRLWREARVENAVGGIAYSANRRLDLTTILNESPTNRFVVGEPVGGASRRLGLIVDVLRRAGIEVQASASIRDEVWRKLLGNFANSPVACLVRQPGRLIAADPALAALFSRLYEEGRAVAAALGVHVETTAAERLAQLQRIDHKTSMLQDLEAGRPLEIDAQLLAVQDFARLTGTPVPLLDTLLPLLAAQARCEAH